MALGRDGGATRENGRAAVGRVRQKSKADYAERYRSAFEGFQYRPRLHRRREQPLPRLPPVAVRGGFRSLCTTAAPPRTTVQLCRTRWMLNKSVIHNCAAPPRAAQLE